MSAGRVLVEDTVEVSSVAELMALVHGMVDRVANPHLQQDDWRATVDYLEETHLSYFDREVDPHGEAWPELAELTIANKGHDIILIEDRKLLDSLTDSFSEFSVREYGSMELTFGTSRPWAWIHQEGGKKIPQRQHTGLSDSGVLGAVQVLADTAVFMMFQFRI